MGMGILMLCCEDGVFLDKDVVELGGYFEKFVGGYVYGWVQFGELEYFYPCSQDIVQYFIKYLLILNTFIK